MPIRRDDLFEDTQVIIEEGFLDLYPFVLSPRIIIKLAFVHEQIHPKRAARDDNGAIRAVIAGLRRAIG